MPLPDEYEDDEDDEPVQEVTCSCRCGACCRELIIETSLEDAAREPRIAQRGSPTYLPPELTASRQRELIGYLQNTGPDHACVFLDDATNRCTIYETRPDCCRAFDCDRERREKLIELGIIER